MVSIIITESLIDADQTVSYFFHCMMIPPKVNMPHCTIYSTKHRSAWLVKNRSWTLQQVMTEVLLLWRKANAHVGTLTWVNVPLARALRQVLCSGSGLKK